MDCKYSLFTNERWTFNKNVSCTIVECRHPKALEDIKNGWKNFAGLDGVRLDIDKNYNIIENSDHLQRRSMFCNETCPFYEE